MPRPFLHISEPLNKKDECAEPKAKEQSEGARPEGAQAGSKARRDLRQQAYEARVSGRNMLCDFL